MLCWLWSSVRRAVKGRHAGVVHKYVDVPGLFRDGVDSTLNIIMRGCAALDRNDVATLLVNGQVLDDIENGNKI